MRYHYEKPEIYPSKYGETYICDHPVYNSCTLYKIGDKGLAVIQQRFNPETKETRWTEIDPWLTDAIYVHPKFKSLFDSLSSSPLNGRTNNAPGIFPTISLRQLMWALKMKLLKRERWETVFDRKDI